MTSLKTIVLDLTRPYLLYQRPLAGPDPTPGEGHGNEKHYGDFYTKRAEPRAVSAIYHFQDGQSPEVGVIFQDGSPSPRGFTEAEFINVYMWQPTVTAVDPVTGIAYLKPFIDSIAKLATAYTPSYINWIVSRGP